MIAGFRLGARCHARAMAIAADSAADVARVVQVKRASEGIACVECGAELEVDDELSPRALMCPNGHAVKLIAAPDPSPKEKAAPVERICSCGKPVIRPKGYIGRTPAKHEECLTPRERQLIEAKRQYNDHVRAKKAAARGAA